MRVIAKVDDGWNIQDGEILDQIKSSMSLEIQMLGDDLIKSFGRSIHLIHDLSSVVRIKYVILHLPIGLHEIEYILSCEWLKRTFEDIILQTTRVSQEYKLHIDILIHITDLYSQVKGLDIQIYLKQLDRRLNNTNVGILIENNIMDLRLRDDESPTLDLLFDDIKTNNISICLDLCHLRASEYCLDREISLSNSYIRKIKNIHFSSTYDHDGYKNKAKTHGRVHKSYNDAMQDILYLESKGINLSDKNIILEINEDDYEHRPDLIKEIKIMNSIF